MAGILKTELGISKSALRLIADARLRDFEVLWKAGHFQIAVYMAGYALEEYLKCAICKTLNVDQLPLIFEYHKLESLLFYSGFDRELRNDLTVLPSFFGFRDNWDVEMRYEDPVSPKYAKYDNALCADVDKWLNDATVGLVPWFRSRIP